MSAASIRPKRRSIRLRGYDYSQAGAYFVTICTQHRTCLFGDIVAGEMRLNEAGKMLARWYSELANKFPDIQCDKFVCMPNHIHFIVVNVGADLRVRPDSAYHQSGVNVGADLRVRPDSCGRTHRFAPTMDKREILGEHITTGEHIGSPLRAVVQWFKTMTTNEYIRGVKQQGWPAFPGKLWQRNYWEHVIRNEADMNRIRDYICINPARWELDSLFPDSAACRIPDR
ncbi:MAG: hypothetical protein A3I78_09965 [Gammaproteobacteria bacterium RIFCSPLOWO2_02_FULL_56_15]|nr:MAG: hypothetical protein A3I78_09965 [Gammaproteobacteria bacterium RIFCSPLOWO2_02_FULL_56_15]